MKGGRGNNFGLQTRDMGKAGGFAMNREVANKAASFSTAATITDRFNQFAQHAKEEGLRRLEEVSRDLVTSYGQGLADQVANGELSPAYAQNLVSAVNTVMNAATRGQWQSVSPTRECLIAQRTNVRQTPATSIDRGRFEVAQAATTERGQAVVGLARDLGLRSKEASLINAKSALNEARNTGKVTIVYGTKGGREREVPITHERQIESLSRAAEIQGEGRSLVPNTQTWSQFRNGELRDTRETLQTHGVTDIHDLRAAYASERYQALTGERTPLEGGQASKADDLAARKILAVELGHGRDRVDVIASYIGGRP
jgi:hypothetical protein